METLQRTLLGYTLLLCVPGVAAAESTGIIIAGVVAGVLLLCLIIGIGVFCYYKQKPLDNNKNVKRPKKKKHKVYAANGYHSQKPHKHRYDKRRAYEPNGYIKQVPMVAPAPAPLPPSQPAPAYIQTSHMPPGPVPYATYHGPPPELRQEREPHPKAGTMSGPPTIFIPYNGTMTVRTDPRPVVHKSSKKSSPEKDERRRSPSRHRSPTRAPAQEFVVQQSYDGVPVIRPVIYVDDDDDRERHRSKSRDRHRSKSRDRRYKKKTTPQESTKITEITDDTTMKTNGPTTTEVVIEHESSSRPKTPPVAPIVLSTYAAPTSHDERSRASSVTEAVNALRMSVKDHLDDSVSTTSHDSSKAPSFAWTKSHRHTDEQRAPDPVAGDVMFLPAGTAAPATRHSAPEPKVSAFDEPKDEVVYSYTKVIKSSRNERAPSPIRESPAPIPGPRPHVNEGYEVPSSLRRSKAGTRDEVRFYETEHDRTTGNYNQLGKSMSDRLQNLVEDGDKTRYSHYNLGAMNFGDEEDKTEEPVQLRVRRPNTPPSDIPNESHYAQVIKRPRTPPNDIPLVSPRESTEVPPLNLRSTINSPREPSYRPSTPPKDFPITPQSSFMRPRPATPPTDFPMTPKTEALPVLPTPRYDVPDTARSEAVDPTTGVAGSFQARRRFIEAHLQKNISPAGPAQSSSASKPAAPKTKVAPPPPPQAPPPQVPAVHITPGVIPPAPPPPPLPK
ncbi:hypothetical protein ACF0H5_000475 [Mactra antiquata]